MTMIEKVAKALMEADIVRNGWSEAFASGLRGDRKFTEQWWAMALIAVAAMREPTEAMQQAGACALGDYGAWVTATDVHRAMIDAALNEGNP